MTPDQDRPNGQPEDAVPPPNTIGLSLSGGGFRAALFHLGALRCLNDQGVLGRLTTISSVSGGSIIAAHIAKMVRPWPAPGATFPNWEQQVSQPFRTFVSKNIRTGPILARYRPSWSPRLGGAQGRALANKYAALSRDKLIDLPMRPEFVFCATDMVFGVNWTYRRNEVGDYMAGYAPPGETTVAEAVAASSSFPPVFQPIAIGGKYDLRGGRAGGPDRQLKHHVSLTDGGVYDNYGMEPLLGRHSVIFVSDGGASLRFIPNKSSLSRLRRYPGIMSNQAASLRRRLIFGQFARGEVAGTYWGIGSLIDNFDPGWPGFSSDLTTMIAEIRTDLDAFSEAESKILENHGYYLADVALHTYVPTLRASAAPGNVPHLDWTDRGRIKQAISDSWKRCWLGRC